jgi:hypothetical protein
LPSRRYWLNPAKRVELFFHKRISIALPDGTSTVDDAIVAFFYEPREQQGSPAPILARPDVTIDHLIRLIDGAICRGGSEQVRFVKELLAHPSANGQFISAVLENFMAFESDQLPHITSALMRSPDFALEHLEELMEEMKHVRPMDQFAVFADLFSTRELSSQELETIAKKIIYADQSLAFFLFTLVSRHENFDEDVHYYLAYHSYFFPPESRLEVCRSLSDHPLCSAEAIQQLIVGTVPTTTTPEHQLEIAKLALDAISRLPDLTVDERCNLVAIQGWWIGQYDIDAALKVHALVINHPFCNDYARERADDELRNVEGREARRIKELLDRQPRRRGRRPKDWGVQPEPPIETDTSNVAGARTVKDVHTNIPPFTTPIRSVLLGAGRELTFRDRLTKFGG